ncbi:AraC family transcriptional regulator ligand-binding domain-containing protein [Pseudomaricurvus sp.]|uniref:AraC family transcriptional regulator n=1 Tax=Pseudomaricurvus sp. TaxID=2004510 RepID=UPI003F6CD51E
MENSVVIPTSFIAVLIRYLDERGLAAPELRETLAELASKPQIANRRFSELLEETRQICPAPAFGVQLGRMIEPRDFGLVGYLLTACSTLGQALTRYGRFQTLILTDLSTQVEVSSGVISHQWSLQDADTPIACEFGVALFISLYQSLIGKAIPPVSVGLPFSEPDDKSLYEALLGCPVEFNTSCLMVDIPANLMWMTISSSDPYLRKIFDRQAEALLQTREQSTAAKQTEGEEDFLEQLQQQLLMAMKDGDTQASHVAGLMGYSLRSFYRKLAEQGYSYRSILSGLRRRLAKKYLADLALSYSDIAMLLGYSEQSAFIRAFKDWMGVTPGEYRKGLEK